LVDFINKFDRVEMQLCASLRFFLTNREGAKSAKEEEEEGLRSENDGFKIDRGQHQSLTQLSHSSFFFLCVLCAFAVNSFLDLTVVRILMALVLSFFNEPRRHEGHEGRGGRRIKMRELFV
jgi:hypothetical protein